MGKHNSSQSLADILANLEVARAYVGNLTVDALASNQEKVDAVLRRLQNASEASTRLRNEWPQRAAEVEARHPEVAWRRFRDLGNRYRHGYDDIDIERVWEDLDGLLRDVERAIRQELVLSDVRDVRPLPDER